MPSPRVSASAAVGNDPHRHSGHRLAWLALALVIGGSIVTIVATLPSALVLPASSLVLVGAGFALAAGLYLSGSRLARRAPGAGVGAWDVAGAFVLIGFTAALLSDSGAALAVIERLQAESAPHPAR